MNPTSNDIDTLDLNQLVITPTNKFWELLESDGMFITKRGKVPGGWLVQSFKVAPINKDLCEAGPVTFVSDANHQWRMQTQF